MRDPWKLILAVLVGGGLGGWLALTLLEREEPRDDEPVAKKQSRSTERPPAPDVDTKTAIFPRRPSYYFSKLRTSGIEIDAMTPMLITPRADEHIGPECPPRLAVVTGDGTHASGVRPYVAAMGDFDLKATEGLARIAAHRIQETWKIIQVTSQGPVTTPPLRVIVTHYPRPSLPGTCVSIQITFYTVKDMYFDEGLMEQYQADPTAAPLLRGVLVTLQKTYQIAGGEPRLIEASVDAHTQVRLMDPRLSIGQLLGETRVGGFSKDSMYGSHFEAFGGGSRYGLAWLDRAAGMGEPDPWSAAYTIEFGKGQEEPAQQTAKLDDALIRSLQELVERA